ncbi:MAG: endonuclease/exonuclease/phosphatase family protein [Bacteroidales bacterium]|nr:endonuclease/exonuclease/phosphatase family protein [Bacteroidales bacterium]
MKHLYKILLFVLLCGLCWGSQAQDLKIISFNIRYNSWENIDGENGWPNRKGAVAKMILEERPAAIGLQEALIDQLQYLDTVLTHYRRIGVGRDDGKEAGEFMAIYYDTTRLELLSHRTRWLSETPDVPTKGWDAACYRTVTIALFRDRRSGQEFQYLNTHLDHVGQTARAEGVKLIVRSLKESSISDHIPVIVGGDMNSTIEDKIFQSFFDVNLKAARELTKRTSHVDTYNAYGKEPSALIDHFFVRNVKVKQFRTLDGNYGVPYISDHYPIEIVIGL